MSTADEQILRLCEPVVRAMRERLEANLQQMIQESQNMPTVSKESTVLVEAHYTKSQVEGLFRADLVDGNVLTGDEARHAEVHIDPVTSEAVVRYRRADRRDVPVVRDRSA